MILDFIVNIFLVIFNIIGGFWNFIYKALVPKRKRKWNLIYKHKKLR